MNWYIVLALAVPFLFLVGVVYSALKEQKVLEDGQLKKVLAERHAKGLINKRGAYDDEDDYGVPARQDLKRSKSEPQQAQAQHAAPDGAPPETAAPDSATSSAEALDSAIPSAAAQEGAIPADVVASAPQQPAAPEPAAALKRHEPLGNTEARDAASYFAKYYK